MPYSDHDKRITDPKAQDKRIETLPLEEVMRQYVRNGLQQLHVSFPAKIVSVTAEQTVDVQPCFKARYVGEPPILVPIIRGVPVLMPMGALWRVSYPLNPGDTGLCIVADRNLDTWLAGDGTPQDPEDRRAHNLGDAVFLPGLVTTGKQTEDTNGDVVIGNGDGAAEIRVGAGSISLKNGSGEALSIIADALTAVVAALATKMIPAPQVTAAATKLKTFKG